MKVRSEYLKKAIEDFIVEVSKIEGVSPEKFGRKIWKKIDGLKFEWQLDAYLDDVYNEAICTTKIN